MTETTDRHGTGDKPRDPTADELRLMTDGEVNVWCSRLRADVVAIQGQIEHWHQNLTPEEWDDDWRDRAGLALSEKRKRLILARVEATRRHARNKHGPMQKPAKSASSKHMAFSYVARDFLDEEVYERIWDAARERYPHLFMTQDTEEAK